MAAAGAVVGCFVVAVPGTDAAVMRTMATAMAAASAMRIRTAPPFVGRELLRLPLLGVWRAPALAFAPRTDCGKAGSVLACRRRVCGRLSCARFYVVGATSPGSVRSAAPVPWRGRDRPIWLRSSTLRSPASLTRRSARRAYPVVRARPYPVVPSLRRGKGPFGPLQARRMSLDAAAEQGRREICPVRAN